jgi:hypothetical protein
VKQSDKTVISQSELNLIRIMSDHE